MGIRFSFFLLLSLSLAGYSLNAKHCMDLSGQLTAMTVAQTELLNTMAKNNDSLALTLDQYANDFSERGNRLKKGDILSLKMSANSYRNHTQRELVLVKRFQKASKELVEKVSQCIAAAVPSQYKTSQF